MRCVAGEAYDKAARLLGLDLDPSGGRAEQWPCGAATRGACAVGFRV